jgi:hypothetical protein
VAVRGSVRVLGQRLDSVRLEKLIHAHLRLVYIGPDGDEVDEIVLPPQ